MLKTFGFVLRKSDYREYDRIYTVYTSDFGKMSLLARGAKKIQSKLAPALESFEEVRIDFAKGKVFNHLSGSISEAKNKNIFKDPEKINLSRDCLYIIDKFIKPEENDKRVFYLLEKTLSAITGAEGDCLQKIKIYFFWKLVEYLGYEPRLDECALCGKASSNVKFNITENIIICSDCIGEGIVIHENSLENLRKIFISSLEEFLKAQSDKQLIAITEKARQIKLSEL
ncbi:MAG: DNA repair protein RecO [Patescibacteria group bacterium]